MAKKDQLREDQALLRRVARGEDEAFDALYQRYRSFVFRVARRYSHQEEDAWDVVQETFAWLVRRADSLELRAKLSTLLYPVVRHQALDLVRRDRRRRDLAAGSEPGAEGDLDQLPAPPEPPPEGSRRADLGEVLAGIPAAQREVLLLRFVDGLSLLEIAESLEIAPGTVKSRLHYALEKLRENPRTRAYFEKRESSNPPAKPDPGGTT